MKAIMIGAGRGQRLMPTTADTPKCFAEVGGRRVLDWALEAFAANGISDIAFVGGYQIDKVRAAYPQFAFRHNGDWAKNNILASHYHRCRSAYAGQPFREAKVFEKAYLIQLFQEMIDKRVVLTPVETPGGYMEIDTQQDFDLARRFWR